jgi:Spy/CpxP family protein refolding chaperone
MKRIWMIALLLSLGLNIGLGVSLWRQRAAQASAIAPVDGPGMLDEDLDPARTEAFMRRRLERMSARLDLADDQREAMWRLHREAGPQVMERRRAMAVARRQLGDAYAGGAVDPDSLAWARRRISRVQAELDSLVVDVMIREREILTPEQFEQYRRFMPMGRDRDHRQGRGGGRRHGHPDEGPRR